jgi:BASS family bile acid:Na+ symporter
MGEAVDLWIQILIAVMLLFVMTSMGLELSLADFRRVGQYPKAAGVGLIGQMIALPLVGIAYAHLMDLSPALAVGVVIITACPGGAPSNIFAYLAGANIPLSISLTAISSVLTVVTIPLWVNLGTRIFMGEGVDVQLPFARTFGQLLAVSILPISIGMLIRARKPEMAERIRPRLKPIVAVGFALATGLIVAAQWEVLVRDFAVAVTSAVVLVIIAIALAYALSRLARLDGPDSFTISIEVGLQNGVLATLIVTNLLQRPELLIFPGTYVLMSIFPVALWTLIYRTFANASSRSEDSLERAKAPHPGA